MHYLYERSKYMELDKYLDRIKNGEEDALRELYELIKNNIYSFALSILRNHDDAIDTLQETFINIYRNIDKYESKSKPLAWIYTITKNVAYSKIRSNKKTINIEEIEFVTHHNYDDKLLIETILKALSEEERKIVILHVVNGFKFHEIARILDLKLSTTLSKYNRAMKKLKLLLKKGEE